MGSAFITPTGRATWYYFFFAAFLAFFFEALAALRFFAINVTSFLKEILHAGCAVSKEILAATCNRNRNPTIEKSSPGCLSKRSLHGDT